MRLHVHGNGMTCVLSCMEWR